MNVSQEGFIATDGEAVAEGPVDDRREEGDRREDYHQRSPAKVFMELPAALPSDR
jgi:hypothetical protein